VGALGNSGKALAQPPFHVFVGTATLDGAPAANVEIDALVNGVECGDTTTDANGNFTLVVGVAGLPGSTAPEECVANSTLTFLVAGVTADQTAVLTPGGDTRPFNLTAVTPTPTPTPAPPPTGNAGLASGGGHTTLWAAAALAGVTLVGLTGLALRRRRA